METETDKTTMTKTAIKTIINQLSTNNISGEDMEHIGKAIASISEKDKDALRANLSLLGFYKKGGVWNAGLIAEIGDILRPNIGAHETSKSIVNVGLKGLGLGAGAYLTYQGGKALLERMGVVGGASAMMAAAATMNGASFGE
jgi:hypothetical protein